MSILNYFKCVPVEPTTDKQLPEPSGPLSKSVPTNATELTNAKVLKLDTACGSRTEPYYLMLTPALRYEVGKRAAEYGVTASIRYFAKKYLKLPLKDSSVWGFKNQWSIILIATTCGSCKFPTSRSQVNSPSTKGLSHID